MCFLKALRTRPAFQKCKTNDIIFDVYRFSNMILANEHRSLGPIFNDSIQFLVWPVMVLSAQLGNQSKCLAGF